MTATMITFTRVHEVYSVTSLISIKSRVRLRRKWAVAVADSTESHPMFFLRATDVLEAKLIASLHLGLPDTDDGESDVAPAKRRPSIITRDGITSRVVNSITETVANPEDQDIFKSVLWTEVLTDEDKKAITKSMLFIQKSMAADEARASSSLSEIELNTLEVPPVLTPEEQAQVIEKRLRRMAKIDLILNESARDLVEYTDVMTLCEWLESSEALDEDVQFTKSAVELAVSNLENESYVLT